MLSLVFALLDPVVSLPPPRLLNQARLVTPSDYPAEASRHAQTGIVSIRLAVTPEGRVSACYVTETSSSPSLDAATCRLVRVRARFAPAIDSATSAGEYRMAVSWGMNDTFPTIQMADRLTVGALPVGYAGPVRAVLAFDGEGRVSSCVATPPSGSASADRAVCRYARSTYRTRPPRSGSDEPSVAIRYLTATLQAGTGN